MHDLDQTTLEAEFDEEFGYEFSDEAEVYGEYDAESPFSEEEEMELASDLLEVMDEQELDQFLGSLIKKAGRAVGKFVKSPVGKALGGVLKKAAKAALPIAGRALGGFVGGPAGAMLGGKLASMAGRTFGLELEGLSPEDQEFEVARRFVRFAGAASKNAAMASPRVPSATAVKTAIATAAKKHAPGLVQAVSISPLGVSGGRTGRWIRRGRKIILLGV